MRQEVHYSLSQSLYVKWLQTVITTKGSHVGKFRRAGKTWQYGFIEFYETILSWIPSTSESLSEFSVQTKCSDLLAQTIFHRNGVYLVDKHGTTTLTTDISSAQQSVLNRNNENFRHVIKY